MEALLIEQWLRGTSPVFIYDEASLTVVRDRIRKVAAEAGVLTDVVDRAVLVGTEIGRNHLRHASAGRIAVRALERGEHRGLELIGADRGPGFADVAAALDAAAREHGTLGVGVSSIRRLSSEVDFDVRIGEGTRIVARVFDRHAPRRREVGVYGRPFPGETVSGDHACFCRVGDALVIGVCDGLGHGPLARDAAEIAMSVLHDHASESLARILEACHSELGKTRGAVMAVTRVFEDLSMLETCSVGNVDVQICSPRQVRRFGGSSAVVGGRPGLAKPRAETAPFGDGDLLVVTSDGISSKLSIEQELALLRAHPIAVAQHIVERFARANDDALVLVAR